MKQCEIELKKMKEMISCLPIMAGTFCTDSHDDLIRQWAKCCEVKFNEKSLDLELYED